MPGKDQGTRRNKKESQVRGPEVTLETDRFTKSAVQVLSFAQVEADNLGSHRVGTEHLLLGFLLEESSGVHQAMVQRGIGLPELREKVSVVAEKAWLADGDLGAPLLPRYSEGCGASENFGAVVRAASSAAQSSTGKVYPDHLFLALAKCTASGADAVLRCFDCSLGEIAADINSQLDDNAKAARGSDVSFSSPAPALTSSIEHSDFGHSSLDQTCLDHSSIEPSDGSLPAEPSVLQYLDSNSLRVLRQSCAEAHALKQSEVSVECLLLALVAVKEGTAYEILASLGFDLLELRRFMRKHLAGSPEDGPVAVTENSREPESSFPLPFSAVFRKVLDMAFLQAKQYGSEYIRSKHLLLGLFALAEGHFLDLLSTMKIEGATIKQRIISDLQQGAQSLSAVASSFAQPDLFESIGADSSGGAALITGEVEPIAADSIVAGEGRGDEVKLSFKLLSLILLAESQCYGLGVPELNCESLLLVTMLMGETFAARCLTAVGVSIEMIEENLLAPEGILGPVVFSMEVEALIDSSRQLARDLNHLEVTVEHLLLELLTEDSFELRHIQEFLGQERIDVARLRKLLFEHITFGDDNLGPPVQTVLSDQECFDRDFDLLFALEKSVHSELFSKLDVNTRLVLMHAARESLAWGRNFIDVEHLLLGLYLAEVSHSSLAVASLYAQIAIYTSCIPGLLISSVSLSERVLGILRQSAVVCGDQDVSCIALSRTIKAQQLGLTALILQGIDEGAAVSAPQITAPEDLSSARPVYSGEVGSISPFSYADDEHLPESEFESSDEEKLEPAKFTIDDYPLSGTARVAMAYARQQVGPEPKLIQPAHIFHALFFIDKELVRMFKVDSDLLDSVRAAGRRGVKQGGQAGFSNDSLRVFNVALDLMHLNQGREIGTTHLLAALCCTEDRTVSNCFVKLALDPEAIRGKLLQDIEQSEN